MNITAKTILSQTRAEFVAAERQFRADLPNLLTRIPGKWVLYTVAGRIAEGENEQELFRQCSQRGLAPGAFLVARVEEDLPPADITDSWFPPE